MDLEQVLSRVGESYSRQGYEVVVRPTPKDLPAFAMDFAIEILAKRGDGGVLVSVKKTREDFSADPRLQEYAEVTNQQPEWRFDFVILESEPPMLRDVQGASEPSDEALSKVLSDADRLTGAEFVNAGVLTAWSVLEAAMRRRLRAEREKAGWGTPPRQMLNELYALGIFSSAEFRELERLLQLRNQIAHGFEPPPLEREAVRFLSDTAKRLIAESAPIKQPA
jgi:hypothetical protein